MNDNQPISIAQTTGKPVVYQVFTRLFGNQNQTNKAWGTIEDNGVGKFNDFTDTALASIKALGVSHIWYTGVLHHAVINDYSAIGVRHDDPDVVKGRAGSPYAVKDYYNVDPDLAVDPHQRLAEFEALIERSHRQGLKVVIDIVPNHVARRYQSISKPAGVSDFGQDDDTRVEYHRDNNFYYVPGQAFKVPTPQNGYQPLNGEKLALTNNPDGQFDEFPAKWTGNGSRQAQPDHNDWYETVKINFGVRPDGSHDFPEILSHYANKSYRQHAAFWADKDVPSSWLKFRQICQFWLAKGVDGFRYDMAEMVPVSFWSYLNSSIKTTNPDAFLLAEIYNPQVYRDYIQLGLMDYLYDKVDFYDTLRRVMLGQANAAELLTIQANFADIDPHLLHFLENHDEHRLASPAFAGNANIGKPAMVAAATIGQSPTMIYFGQELGEVGQGHPGFGGPDRTTIFDYWGIASLQRWNNQGKFDGGGSTPAEQSLRDFYQRLLTFSASNEALTAKLTPLAITANNSPQLLAYSRWSANQRLLIVTNFSHQPQPNIQITLPATLTSQWQLQDGSYPLAAPLFAEPLFADPLFAEPAITNQPPQLDISGGIGQLTVTLAPLGSVIYEVR